MTGIFLANVADDLDLRRNDVQLLGNDIANLDQQLAVLITASFGCRQVMDHIDTRQVIRQRPAATLLAIMCRNEDLIVRICSYLNIALSLVEQPDLTR